MARNRRVVLKKGKGLIRKWYFIVQAANHRITAVSTTYLTRQRARKTAKTTAVALGADYIERD